MTEDACSGHGTVESIAPAVSVSGIGGGVVKLPSSAKNPDVPDLSPDKVSNGKFVPRFIFGKRQRDIFGKSTDEEESNDR